MKADVDFEEVPLKSLNIGLATLMMGGGSDLLKWDFVQIVACWHPKNVLVGFHANIALSNFTPPTI